MPGASIFYSFGMSDKICSQCHLLKSKLEFNFKNKSLDLRHSYCRECGKIFTRNHYKKSKESYLKRNLRSYGKRRKIVVEAKQHPCADCGVQYPYYVMDFDHRENEIKSFPLNRVNNATVKVILAEMAKCDLVCANCHRERTHQRSLAKKN